MKLLKICLSSALIFALSNAANYQYEVVPKIGQNFFDDDSGLDDETNYGIDLNYYLNKQAGVQVGYSRISKASYLWYSPQDTDIDRFYLNALYEPVSYGAMTPYFLGGVGYEKLSNEIGNQKSQPFVNAGIGVKYAMSSAFDLVAEAKYIRKLDSMDADIATNVGFGYKFGMPMNNMQSLATNSAQTQNQISYKQEPLPLPDQALENVDTAMTQEELPMPSEQNPKGDIFSEHEQLQNTLSNAAQSTSTDNISGYFVQVGAYAYKAPDQRYLEEIENQGYNLTLHEATVKGKRVTKILIGPYSSYEEAKRALSKIKASITNRAFIYKI